LAPNISAANAARIIAIVFRRYQQRLIINTGEQISPL